MYIFILLNHKYGLLGDGTTSARNFFSKIPTENYGIKTIEIGLFHSFIIREDGRGFSMGRNDVILSN
jgi:alpha-tubulin suppressor-like RCC1 family protein